MLRFRSLTFGSQAKLVLLLSLASAAPIFLMLLLGEIGGADILEGDTDITAAPVIGVVVLFFASLLLALFIAIPQLVAVALLRLLPWRGPALHTDGEPDRSDLGRIFE